MVKGAGDHFEAGGWFFIWRHKPHVISVDILWQSFNKLFEESPRCLISGGKKIVVDTPRSPDEPIENVRRWMNDVLLYPDVAQTIRKYHASLLCGTMESLQGPVRSHP